LAKNNWTNPEPNATDDRLPAELCDRAHLKFMMRLANHPCTDQTARVGLLIGGSVLLLICIILCAAWFRWWQTPKYKTLELSPL